MLILAFISCGKQKKNENCPMIKLDLAETASLDKIFSKIEIVSLQNRGGVILPDVSQLVVTDRYFLVKDSKGIVYVYTKDGSLVSNSLKKMGNGAGEYSIVTALGFNPYAKNIEILTPRDLLCYDFQFNLIKKEPLPVKSSDSGKNIIFFAQIYDLSAERHILVPTSVSENTDKMLIYNSSLSKVEQELDYTDEFIAGINMQEQCFFESDNGVVIAPPFVTEYLYTFDKDKMQLAKLYRIDNGSKGIQKSELSKLDTEELQNFLLDTEKEIPVVKLVTNKYVTLLMKSGRSLRNWHYVFYDKSSGSVKKIKCFVGKENVLPIIKNANSEALFAVVENTDLNRIISYMKKNNIKVDSKSSVDGDYSILKYVFK